MSRDNRSLCIKIMAASVALSLCVFYILFTYSQASQLIHNKNQALLLKTKTEINEAVESFFQYLNLTEARLSSSLDEPKIFPHILSGTIEHALNKTFPVVMGMTFIPASNSEIAYTEFEKTLLVVRPKEIKQKEAVFFEGGTFTVVRKIFNKDKQMGGMLEAIFSLNNILYKNFSRNDINILSINAVDFTKNPLYFDIKVLPTLPYVVVVRSASLTLWQFLLESKLYIFSTLLLACVVFFVGMPAGAFVMRRSLVKQRAFNQRLRSNVKTLDKKKTEVDLHLAASQNLATQKERSYKTRQILINSLSQRYRQMAGKAQAINMLTSKLILEEAENDKLLKEIHSVSQEGMSVLRQLINGFPMTSMEEEIDVFECIQNTQRIFLPEIIEKGIIFEITGKVNAPPHVDKVIFEIILHNIFHMIMDRFSKNGLFKIILKGADPLQIIFYDNGYDMADKIHAVKSSFHPEDILCLGKSRLQEFISYLGYELSFESAGDLSNSITLAFPLILKESELPSNVVKLFDCKSHGK